MPRSRSASEALLTLLGIERMIVQAPMAGVQGSALAIAVSRAGGLGSLPCAMLDASAIRSEVATIRAATAKPFALNFFCHSEPAPELSREAAWRRKLAPYYEELGLDPEARPLLARRRPFSPESAALVGELSPPVVSFHFGLPAPDLLARVRAAGAKILATATSADEARWLEAHGVDAIVAQGIEAGGHRGSFLGADLATGADTASLVDEVAAAVPLPVIAAGGIAGVSDVAAMRERGAAAVQVGTAYLLCPEATTRPWHRGALESEAARRTVVTNVLTGRPARGIANRLIRDLGPIDGEAPAFPLAADPITPLRAKAESLGRGDFSPLWAGTGAARCRALPAAEITRALTES